MEFDLHVHSRYSFDCNMKPRRIVEVAKKRGLFGVAIVDHESAEGGREGLQYASDDFIVIPGIEIGTTEGDIIGYFVTEDIKTDDPLEAIAAIKEHGGLAVLAHPFSRKLIIKEEVVRQLDAIEGFNARHARASLKYSYGEPHIVKFAREYNLPLTAGSDAHLYREIGRGRCIIPASTSDEVRDVILQGNTLAFGEKTSIFWFALSKFLSFFKT